MKDYYLRMGLAIDAEPAEIRAARYKLPLEERDAVEFIILNPDRRSVYDRHIRLLREIGLIRQAAGLSFQGHWSSGSYSDFSPAPSPRSDAGPANPPRDSADLGDRAAKKRLVALLFVIGGAFLMAVCIMYSERPPTAMSRSAGSGAGTVRRQRNPFELPPGAHPLPRPDSGLVSMGITYGPLAPLTVSVPAGSNDYFVKLVSVPSGVPAATFFVRAGERCEIGVPLGTYSLRYAYGETWYGSDLLFGPATRTIRADTDLVFYTEGNRLLGNRVELIPQVGGNLGTTAIDQGDF